MSGFFMLNYLRNIHSYVLAKNSKKWQKTKNSFTVVYDCKECKKLTFIFWHTIAKNHGHDCIRTQRIADTPFYDRILVKNK